MAYNIFQHLFSRQEAYVRFVPTKTWWLCRLRQCHFGRLLNESPSTPCVDEVPTDNARHPASRTSFRAPNVLEALFMEACGGHVPTACAQTLCSGSDKRTHRLPVIRYAVSFALNVASQELISLSSVPLTTAGSDRSLPTTLLNLYQNRN